MKAHVEFKDGRDFITVLPDEMRHVTEITIGHPDRMENVKARYVGWHGKGHAMFKEVADDRPAS